MDFNSHNIETLLLCNHVSTPLIPEAVTEHNPEQFPSVLKFNDTQGMDKITETLRNLRREFVHVAALNELHLTLNSLLQFFYSVVLVSVN